MFTDNDNPYQSPAASGKGEYDWTLAKQAFVTVAIVLLMWLIPAAVGSYRIFSQLPTHANKTPVSTIVSFLSDWRASN